MVWDGECNFCRRWILRWQQITGETVDYMPSQDPRVAEQFPEISATQFERAVQLIETDGQIFSGAEAVFRALHRVRRSPLWIYQHVPGAAPLTEAAYRFVASHRMFFSTLTQLLWGESVERASYVWVRWLFVRLLGLIYLIAFVSLWTQISGLIGSNGISPAAEEMRALREAADQRHISVLERFHIAPTFCWWRDDDRFLHWQCGAGAVLSVLVMAGIAPAPCLFLLWLVYLSLTTVCGVFLGFQWDALLLETGLLAIFFAPGRLWPNVARETAPSGIVLWLLRWLQFRLMFASGCVKLTSGDPAWRNLTALNFHYETQPLPTWAAWCMHQLPEWFQKTSVLLMFGIELVVPFLIFLPRRLRLFAFWPLVALQLVITVTGNYTFFNLLTIFLCVPLLDDRALLSWLSKLSVLRQRSIGQTRMPRTRSTPGLASKRWRVFRSIAVGVFAAVILVLSSMLMIDAFRIQAQWPAPIAKLYRWATPFRSVNSYGLFSVMTTSRPEIIVEGSKDGQTWQAYEFKYKPGDVRRRPRFVAPHQPRLDWQMWFAALGDVRQNPWFVNFCVRLLQGSPSVLALLAQNPFPDGPPKYIRAQLYDYHFTNFEQRRADGAWWRREFKNEYCPSLSLRKDNGQ